jgi:cell division septation protein DedD
VASLETEIEALSALAATAAPPAETHPMVVTLSASPQHEDAAPSPAVAPLEREPAAAEPAATPPPALAAEPVTPPAETRKKAAQPAAAATTRPASRPGREPLPMPDGGPWTVVVQSFDNEAAAERRRNEAVRLGIPAEVREAEVKGQLWHRVVVPGYSSQQSAQTAATELGRRKLGTPWILLTRTPD